MQPLKIWKPDRDTPCAGCKQKTCNPCPIIDKPTPAPAKSS